MVIGVDRVPPTTAINDDFGPGGGNVETAGDFDPVNEGIDFWESLEGMLVRVNAPTAVSPTIANGTSQEIWVTAAGTPATGTTERGGIGISAGDFNPERIQLDDMINADVMPTVDVGARLSDVTGVINYDFASYEVLLRTMPVVTAASTLDREVTTLAPGADLLRVATFNVENLHPGSGADKFTSLAQAIVTNLRTPQIINLEEVQDNSGPTNNGVVDADDTLQMLVDAIVAAGGPEYEWRQINPVNNQDGGQLGGNIRVAFLFDPAQGVGFVDGSLARITDTTPADGDAFVNSRKPLVGTFTYNGESITVIGNHFNSKGGDGPLYGTTQPPLLVTEAQRLQQAEVVSDYVYEMFLDDVAAKVIVLGDLNDFEFSKPLEELKGIGLAALIETLPGDQRYTYNFEGNAQALDHILASPAMAKVLQGYDVVHINSEFSTQVSDHDPVIAQFLIEAVGATIDGTPGRDALVGTAGADVITGRGGRDTLTGGGSGDRFVYASLLDASDVITDFELGRDRLVIDALLGSVGYTGSTPVADGYLSITTAGGNTQVLFDADGSAGGGAARALVELTGVTAPSAGVLLDPTAFGA